MAKAKEMTRADAQEALEGVRAAMHDQYAGDGEARYHPEGQWLMSKTQMSCEDAKSALAAVKAAMHDQYGEHHQARLAQLDAALATASMAVEHLADEEAREVDLAQRIVNREPVHRGEEAVSPVSRSFEHTRRIAGKG